MSDLTTFIKIEEAAKMCGISVSTVKRAVQIGDFPSPRKITKGRTGFIKGEIKSWIENRPATTKIEKPVSRVSLTATPTPPQSRDAQKSYTLKPRLAS